MRRVEAIAKARSARIAKLPPMPDRFWLKVARGAAGQCWEWTAFRNKDGYGQFRFQGKSYLSSRWAWILTNGPLKAGIVVCHRCDNPPCCNPEHLFIGTPKQNVVDQVLKGRQVRGSRVKVSVMTEEQVIVLRKRVSEVGLRAASSEMGIKYWTARYACNGGWRHV